jgi:uncharacterized membrane protein
MTLVRRVAGSAEWVIVSLQLVLVVVLLGPPNLAAAGEYFSGQLPGERATLALASLLVWIVAVALAVVAIVGGLRRIRAHRVATRHARAVAVLLGLCLLGFGLAHRFGGDVYSQCCGSLTVAEQLAHAPQPGSGR